AEEREEKFLIKGCQSQVWIIPFYDSAQHLLYFKADSDSLLVKGLVSLLVTVYHGQHPEDIFEEKG
ncbi:MAG: SufE family protein, partial [bacterium]